LTVCEKITDALSSPPKSEIGGYPRECVELVATGNQEQVEKAISLPTLGEISRKERVVLSLPAARLELELKKKKITSN